MRNTGGLLLIVGITLLILSTAYLTHLEGRTEIARLMDRVRDIRARSGNLPTRISLANIYRTVGIAMIVVGFLITALQQSGEKLFFAGPREYLGKTIVIFTIMRMGSSALLVRALGRHSNDFYTLLRLTVCGVAAYGVYLGVRYKRIYWTWVFGIVAVLFNPLVPIRLEKTTWAIIDVCVAIVFAFSILLMKVPNAERQR